MNDRKNKTFSPSCNSHFIVMYIILLELLTSSDGDNIYSYSTFQSHLLNDEPNTALSPKTANYYLNIHDISVIQYLFHFPFRFTIKYSLIIIHRKFLSICFYFIIRVSLIISTTI